MRPRPLLRASVLALLLLATRYSLLTTAQAQPAPVLADPTTGALFRPTNLVTPLGNATGTLLGANGGTGIANTGKTLTLGGNVTTLGAFGLTLTLTGTTNVTLPATGTLATLAGTETLTNKTLTTPILGTATATSITAPAATPLTIAGGTNGVVLSLGQGAAGRFNITAPASIYPLRADNGKQGYPTNTAFGQEALDNIGTGTVSVTLPSGATINATGNYNTGFGQLALNATTHGEDNTAFGAQALYLNTNGFYNSAFGHYALGRNTLGDKNTAVGTFSLETQTTGFSNSAVGFQSLNQLSTGYGNAALGQDSLRYSTTGNYNTGVGINALNQNTTGSNNTGLGRNALYDATTGANNTVVGAESGRDIITGSNNTILGANITGLAAALSGNVIVGDGLGNIRAQHNGSTWTLSGGVEVTGALSATGAITSLVGGQNLSIAESSVNGATIELIAKGKNSVGTARQANIGINRFADDVLSVSNGTTEYLRLNLTNGALTTTGVLTVNGTSAVNALSGGTQLATFESSVNGATVELITKGKNSVGTARQANLGINRFADDVFSISNGTTEWQRINLTTGAAAFVGAVTHTLGTNLPPQTAPASPASGWVLYTDSGDSNKLKAKASTGTVVTLGTP
jgi:hypothetical protein